MRSSSNFSKSTKKKIQAGTGLKCRVSAFLVFQGYQHHTGNAAQYSRANIIERLVQVLAKKLLSKCRYGHIVIPKCRDKNSTLGVIVVGIRYADLNDIERFR